MTLVEMLVSTAILALILIVILQSITMVSQNWKSGSVDAWAPAEDAFARISQRLAAATLEPYQDYVDATGAVGSSSGFVPDHLARCSDLAFISGPGLLDSTRITAGDGVFFISPHGYSPSEAHNGLDRLLNAEGYYVEFDNDTGPFTSQSFYRWRLKEIVQPSEDLNIFTTTTSAAFLQQLVPAGTSTPTLADNIIALLVLPERAAQDTDPDLAPTFHYDSRDATQPLTHHQLPPRIKLALVAIKELSAQTLAQRYGTTAPPLLAQNLFQNADHFSSDLSTLDGALTDQKIEHRIFQRDLSLPASAWTETPSP